MSTTHLHTCTLCEALWVPLGSTPLVLKAKDTWPRTAKV
jgi:hypothetical protein